MDFREIALNEMDAVRLKRRKQDSAAPAGAPPHGGAPPDSALNELESLGLAISGGGIRSATFALGILQHLASLKLLRRLDYLSTVSGGGYIGSWLTAWLQRHFAKGESWTEFEDRLKPAPDTGYRPASGSTAKEPFPLRWLRKYGNYLSPDLSAFSADTWSILMIWVRNAMLNQVILFAILAVVLLLGRLLSIPFQHCPVLLGRTCLFLLAAVFLLLPVAWITYRLWTMARNSAPKVDQRIAGQTPAILASISMLAFSYCISLVMWWWQPEHLKWTGAIGVFLLSMVVMLPGLRRRTGGAVASCVLGAALGSGAFYALVRACYKIFHTLDTYASGRGVLAAAIGAPLILWAISLVVVLLLGVAGRHVEDNIREWWSRLGAWLGLVGIAALSVNLISVFGPLLLMLIWWKTSVAVSLGGGWFAATFAALRSAWGPGSTGSGDAKPSLADRLLPLAPPVLVLGILLFLASGVDALLTKARSSSWWLKDVATARNTVDCHGCAHSYDPRDSKQVWAVLQQNPLWNQLDTLPKLVSTSMRSQESDIGTLRQAYLARVEEHRTGHVVIFLFVFGGIALLFAWRVDINEFSMYAFYRNRLVRCYLGASKFDDNEETTRGADPFTNLGVQDDLALDQLQVRDGSTYCGPIHLVNTAINLSGEGSGRAERRASSFVFTPYACGFHPEIHHPGHYREVSCANKVTLGSAVTVSGAAASPNMGYHTSAPLAFLMTMFNVRLGLWFPNVAAKKPVPGPSPGFGISYLLAELFALANLDRDYVYLSDGGHFENLAVYELLRRRCRYIIVCDGEADEALAFEGLGSLIRKARADFGIEIEMDTSAISTRSEAGFSQAHCATGVIRYPDPAATGTLLYLKASVTGDEPGDVLHYRSTHKEFPHQSTGDQFFSESQFESYRRLGIHVAEQAFRVVNRERKDLALPGNHEMFLQLRQAWRGSPVFSHETFTDHTRKLQELMDQLRTEQELAYLNPQIYPEWRHFQAPTVLHAAKPWELPAGVFAKVFYFCHNLIQLMEEVYLDLDLEANADHPDLSGWMNLFQHWAWSDAFRLTYAIVAPTFGGRFRRFCERHFLLRLDEDANGVSSVQIKDAIEVSAATEGSGFTAWEVEFLKTFDSRGLKVRQIRCNVPNALHPSDTKDFPIGFALLGDGDRLCWIRIQNHLRCMGFGRAAIKQLKDKHKGLNMDEGDSLILGRVTDPRFGDSGTKAHLTWVRERLKSD